jgi:hypothetical protein
MNETQHQKILRFMRENPAKEIWLAKDFQQSPFFIGYEA